MLLNRKVDCSPHVTGRRCPISSDKQSVDLKWSSDRAFSLWQYTLSHSQLFFHGYSESSDDVIQVLFDGVERIESDRHYLPPFGFTFVEEHGRYPGVLHFSRLLVKLIGANSDGFVAASGIRITRNSREGEELELLYFTSKTEEDQRSS